MTQLMKLNLTQGKLISESRKITEEPDWWKEKTKSAQKKYLAKYPKSQMAKFLKRKEAERKAKGETFKLGKKKPKKAFGKPKRSAKAEKLALVAESVTRNEIKRRKNKKIDGIITALNDQREKFSSRLKSVGTYINAHLSDVKKSQLGSFLMGKMRGMTSKKDKQGEKVAQTVTYSLAKVALGIGTLAMVFAGSPVLAGLFASAFLGYSDYTKAAPQLENAPQQTEDSDLPDENDVDKITDAAEASLDEDPDDNPVDLESRSSDLDEIGDDPVQFLTDEFAVWFMDQDVEEIADQIAEFMAVSEMKAEGWQPNLSDMTDEEMDIILAPKDVEDFNVDRTIRSLSSEEVDEVEDFEVEHVDAPDDAPKRLTLRCDKECVRLPHDQRWRYNIRYGNRIIGNIRCLDKNTGGKFTRLWICVLEDGFNESVYRSGKPMRNDTPYTLVKFGKIYLIQPIKQTFDETWAWAKLNIDKEFL